MSRAGTVDPLLHLYPERFCPEELQEFKFSPHSLFFFSFFFSFLFLKYVSLNPDLSRLSWDFEFAAQSLRMSIVFQGTAL